MLNIGSTGSTNWTVTLYEYCQNQVNPYFTWNINRKGSNDSITFTSDDVSTAPYYWNSFNITVATSSVGLTSGVIPIFEGEWLYYVHEMQNQYDLDIDNSIGMVEQGIIVCGLTFSDPSTIPGPSSSSIPVFRPNY